MRVGLDYTSAVRQRAGIGRYTRELVAALVAQESEHSYTFFAATGGLDPSRWQREAERLRALRRASGTPLRFRSLPVSDDWVARLWHRLRLPIPVEVFTGPLDLFYSPDFALLPTGRATHTLLTVHDLSFLHYPECFVPKLVDYLNRVVSRSVARADLVLADSQATRSDLIAHLGMPEDRVMVLYPGATPDFCPQEETGEIERIQARYRLDDRPYVLSVGTVQPRKNYVRLMQAFANLEADAQLVIAGGRGWLYEDIVAEAERHADRVRLLGFVDDADLPALYRQASACALPSLYEGFGFPVLEAMACGTPVICSNVSSLPEVAGQAGLLVDPLDVDGLTAALAQVLEDESLGQHMRVQGLVQARKFSWEKAAGQLLAIFSCLRGSGPHPHSRSQQGDCLSSFANVTLSK